MGPGGDERKRETLEGRFTTSWLYGRRLPVGSFGRGKKRSLGVKKIGVGRGQSFKNLLKAKGRVSTPAWKGVPSRRDICL